MTSTTEIAAANPWKADPNCPTPSARADARARLLDGERRHKVEFVLPRPADMTPAHFSQFVEGVEVQLTGFFGGCTRFAAIGSWSPEGAVPSLDRYDTSRIMHEFGAVFSVVYEPSPERERFLHDTITTAGRMLVQEWLHVERHTVYLSAIKVE